MASDGFYVSGARPTYQWEGVCEVLTVDGRQGYYYHKDWPQRSPIYYYFDLSLFLDRLIETEAWAWHMPSGCEVNEGL